MRCRSSSCLSSIFIFWQVQASLCYWALLLSSSWAFKRFLTALLMSVLVAAPSISLMLRLRKQSFSFAGENACGSSEWMIFWSAIVDQYPTRWKCFLFVGSKNSSPCGSSPCCTGGRRFLRAASGTYPCWQKGLALQQLEALSWVAIQQNYGIVAIRVWVGQQIYRMNYNELTFHKASPFYKQDFMPDRAWFNRKAKDFPSQMPSGQDYFVDSGRKHFASRFNHSQIEYDNILKSPERYPFENRIAMDKTYMRSLHTIDIEGASSNTRVNQSIKNKYKAQDQLARRHNQSVEVAKAKEKTEQEKKREVALRQYHEYQQRSLNRVASKNKAIDNSQVSMRSNEGSARNSNPEQGESPSLRNQLSEEYKRFVMQNSSNKWNKDIPKPQIQPSSDSSRLAQQQSISYQTLDPNIRRYSSSNVQEREQEGQRYEKETAEGRGKHVQGESSKGSKGGALPAPTPHSHYQYQFNGDSLKYNEEYQRILKYEELSRQIMHNSKDFRKNNPTNLSLSFNLAGQNIVSN